MIMNRQISQLLNLARRCVVRPHRFQSDTAETKESNGVVDKGYINLKKIQARFQKDDKLPVFLKGGKTDDTLYKVTLGLTAFGVLYTFAFLIGYIISGLQ